MKYSHQEQTKNNHKAPRNYYYLIKTISLKIKQTTLRKLLLKCNPLSLKMSRLRSMRYPKQSMWTTCSQISLQAKVDYCRRSWRRCRKNILKQKLSTSMRIIIITSFSNNKSIVLLKSHNTNPINKSRRSSPTAIQMTPTSSTNTQIGSTCKVFKISSPTIKSDSKWSTLIMIRTMRSKRFLFLKNKYIIIRKNRKNSRKSNWSRTSSKYLETLPITSSKSIKSRTSLITRLAPSSNSNSLPLKCQSSKTKSWEMS